MKKFIYIYDAYCPWCYAFTPIVEQLYDQYHPVYEFEVLSGGMIIDDQIKSIGGTEKSKKLRKNYQTIVQRTGIQFGEAFFTRIRDKETLMNSEVPARALAVFRETESPYSSITFVHKLINSLFLEGRNPNEDSIYRDLAVCFDLDPEWFVSSMNLDHFQQQARYDFALSKQLQAEAFPRLYLQTADDYFHLVSKGFSDYNKIVQIIDKITTSV